MFVKILVYVKICLNGEEERRKEDKISILRSARGKLIAIRKTLMIFPGS